MQYILIIINNKLQHEKQNTLKYLDHGENYEKRKGAKEIYRKVKT